MANVGEEKLPLSIKVLLTELRIKLIWDRWTGENKI